MTSLSARFVGVAALVFLSPLAFSIGETTTRAQSANERLWLAGRYDATHFIVYFEAVHFAGTYPKTAKPLVPPVPTAFFNPEEVGASTISRFVSGPGRERFALGDQYDLLLDGGRVASLSLSKLVAFHSDEGSGNDSYIGAIGQVSNSDLALVTNDYYALRRHVNAAEASASSLRQALGSAQLLPSVPPDVSTASLRLLAKRLNGGAVSSRRLQAFVTASGDRRYFAIGRSGSADSCATLRAWLAPTPSLHVIAADRLPYCDDDTLADGTEILNVVDLGRQRTGLIVILRGRGGMGLQLVQYQDGRDLEHMRRWQRISYGD